MEVRSILCESYLEFLQHKQFMITILIKLNLPNGGMETNLSKTSVLSPRSM